MKHNLRQELLMLRAELDREMQTKWHRSLPLDELLSDRWERAKQLGFAEGASIYSNSIVFGKVKVGEKSWIGPYTILDGSAAEVHIGAYCNISAGVHLYSHDTVHWCLSGGKAAKREGAVRIGHCTYIGPNSIIQHNITIGDHCVIGAGSLVNRSIPSYSFAGGNPCKILGKVITHADGSYTFSKSEA